MGKKLSVREQNIKDNYELNQKRIASEEARWDLSCKSSTERNIMAAATKNKKKTNNK